jgi:hypothetical protein
MSASYSVVTFDSSKEFAPTVRTKNRKGNKTDQAMSRYEKCLNYRMYVAKKTQIGPYRVSLSAIPAS